ncbi:TetR/AcrR family transcriptional regulator [Chitinophaga sp. S165]|uniref:TetR/AcrR family transcriptional regulator n=1 Tax=Chitinophaga sp. S165 TaxID=2135462 RepID=UPI000D810719|nr:TetR/AcrR family transcriptional regulator [Chitinophaga sp. S165]PWV51562.1 TetR family transcriptional regulator [Chitinophaga sp. S165]
MRDKRKNAVREAIVDTASRLFYQQGYVNTGINQIIEESGVVKSSLYQGFRSKEDILMAYLESAGAATDEALLNATRQYEEPQRKILAVFDYLINLVQQSDYYGCNFLNIISEIPKDAERVRNQIKKQKDGVRNLFRSILAPIDKGHLADEIYILFDGALIANKVHGEIWPVTTARSMAQLLMK